MYIPLWHVVSTYWTRWVIYPLKKHIFSKKKPPKIPIETNFVVILQFTCFDIEILCPLCKCFAETYMNFLLILFWILSEIFLNSISEIWLKLEHSRQISESAEQKISKNFSNISVFFQQIIQFWNLSEFGTFQTVFSIQQSSENFPAITQQCFSSI